MPLIAADDWWPRLCRAAMNAAAMFDADAVFFPHTDPARVAEIIVNGRVPGVAGEADILPMLERIAANPAFDRPALTALYEAGSLLTRAAAASNPNADPDWCAGLVADVCAQSYSLSDGVWQTAVTTLACSPHAMVTQARRLHAADVRRAGDDGQLSVQLLGRCDKLDPSYVVAAAERALAGTRAPADIAALKNPLVPAGMLLEALRTAPPDRAAMLLATGRVGVDAFAAARQRLISDDVHLLDAAALTNMPADNDQAVDELVQLFDTAGGRAATFDAAGGYRRFTVDSRPITMRFADEVARRLGAPLIWYRMRPPVDAPALDSDAVEVACALVPAWTQPLAELVRAASAVVAV